MSEIRLGADVPWGEFVTITEAGEMCNVSRQQIRNWIRGMPDGRKLRTWRIGSRLHTTRDALAAFVAATSAPTEEGGIRVVKMLEDAEGAFYDLVVFGVHIAGFHDPDEAEATAHDLREAIAAWGGGK